MESIRSWRLMSFDSSRPTLKFSLFPSKHIQERKTNERGSRVETVFQEQKRTPGWRVSMLHFLFVFAVEISTAGRALCSLPEKTHCSTVPTRRTFVCEEFTRWKEFLVTNSQKNSRKRIFWNLNPNLYICFEIRLSFSKVVVNTTSWLYPATITNENCEPRKTERSNNVNTIGWISGRQWPISCWCQQRLRNPPCKQPRTNLSAFRAIAKRMYGA